MTRTDKRSGDSLRRHEGQVEQADRRNDQRQVGQDAKARDQRRRQPGAGDGREPSDPLLHEEQEEVVHHATVELGLARRALAEAERHFADARLVHRRDEVEQDLEAQA